MGTRSARLRSPALISSLLVLPVMILELVNRRYFDEGFPIPLFVFLWLLPMIFTVRLMSILRDVRTGNRTMTNPIGLVVNAALLIFVAWLWIGTLIDQMPCFLGVPNCD